MESLPTALVMDDEIDLAWAVQQALVLDGWRVVVAHTGAAAVALAASESIHIAFLDAKLPDMDGLDVAQRIAAMQPGAMMVLISGFYYSEDQAVREALCQGLFTDFIGKPFDLAEISSLARRALAS